MKPHQPSDEEMAAYQLTALRTPGLSEDHLRHATANRLGDDEVRLAWMLFTPSSEPSDQHPQGSSACVGARAA